MKLYFKIPGIPQPKQSFRFTKSGKKYQFADVKNHEHSISVQILQQLPRPFKPFTCGLKMKCLYVFPFTDDFSKKKLSEADNGKIFYKTTKPDVTDNLNKGLTDAMEGIVFINDSRICKFEAEKIYGSIPRTEIWIEPIEQ